MSDLSTVSLKELYEAINKSSIIGRKSYILEFRVGGREENLSFFRPVVNSTEYFNDFQRDII
jgi:hypothetical protein